MTTFCKKKLKLERALLNLLLKILSPTNKLVIYISQDLDKVISKYQKRLYIKYTHNTIIQTYKKTAA